MKTSDQEIEKFTFLLEKKKLKIPVKKMETPLISKVKTLHKALMKMAESIGISNLPADLSDPKNKMSEIVHQMNNIYAKIASVLSGHNETQQKLIDENIFLKEKLSQVLRNGDSDITKLNHKLIAGEVWSAQVHSYVENFPENPIESLKYMKHNEKLEKLTKLSESSSNLDLEIEKIIC